MITIEREELKSNETFSQLHRIVKEYHRVADHTKKVLMENKDVKDFCEEGRHFVLLEGKPALFIHYDTSSWFKKPNGVQMRIDRIAIYDNFMEYEGARVRGLHGGKPADIPNVN